MKMRTLLAILGVFGVGQIAYGYKVNIINETADRVQYKVRTTNVFVGAYEGFVDPGETSGPDTGGNCLSSADIMIKYSGKEAGSYKKQQKKSVSFGGLCQGFTLRVSESCKADKDGNPTDCQLKVEQL